MGLPLLALITIPLIGRYCLGSV